MDTGDCRKSSSRPHHYGTALLSAQRDDLSFWLGYGLSSRLLCKQSRTYCQFLIEKSKCSTGTRHGTGLVLIRNRLDPHSRVRGQVVEEDVTALCREQRMRLRAADEVTSSVRASTDTNNAPLLVIGAPRRDSLRMQWKLRRQV